YGPIPEGVTYITKAAIDRGVWRLVDKDSLKEKQLTDLREEDLEPTAKWLSIEHEDLVEETLKELAGLRGEKEKYIKNGLNSLVEALGWGYGKVKSERKAFEELKREKVEDNLTFFIGGRLNIALKPLSNNCWRRAALIIGFGLAGIGLMPKAEDLPEYVRESLKSALNKCEVDEYLLADNRIPLFVVGLAFYPVMDTTHLFNISGAFVDKFSDAVGEINRINSIAEERGGITVNEEFYSLGLASIIANAVRSGKDISAEDADKTIKVASFAIDNIRSTELIVPILGVLELLRDKASYTYLVVLGRVAGIENLDPDTVIYVLEQLNKLSKRDDIMEHKWSVFGVLIAYVNLLRHLYLMKGYEYIVKNIKYLLNALSDDTPLGKIAYAGVLSLELEGVLKEEITGIDVVSRAKGLLNELDELGRDVKNLLNNIEFMEYVKSNAIKVDEELVRRIIMNVSLRLKLALAKYKRNNDELSDAIRLYAEAAEENKEIGDFVDYLICSTWVLRLKFTEGSLSGNNLVKEYERLFKEALDNLKPTALNSIATSDILAGYLVSLALTNNTGRIADLSEKYRGELYANKEISVLTRLMLNVLLGSNNVTFNVSPRELIEAHKGHMQTRFLPALYVALGLAKPEEGINMCEKLSGNEEEVCKDVVDVVKGDRDATDNLRNELMKVFLAEDLRRERESRLKSLGVSDDEIENIYDNYTDLVYKLDGRSLIQMFVSLASSGEFALMLNALVNKDFDLARAIALHNSFYVPKLLTRLFLEAYKSCCDLNNENFRQALAKLLFYHF
ncbi:hypothetical protein B9Q04_16635, partial [Candidatus Marsarchaeota G2 archaeon BE_D]